MNAVILKKGKEKAILNKHHWIFSGAVEHAPKQLQGDLHPVQSFNGQHLGWGYFNHKTSIMGRMVSFDETPPLDSIKQNLERAILMRQNLIDTRATTAYRLVNGEGDALPGLTIDRYDNTLVIQLTTKGMDRLRSTIVDYLRELLSPTCIFEKSVSPSRHEEGLDDCTQTLHGTLPTEIIVKENNLSFVVQPDQGQKTGFFIDHREMRQEIKALSKGKKVLNCFGYTGGFSVYALAGGATHVDTVDISQSAIDLAKVNVEKNGFHSSGFHAQDVFEFLRQNPLDYNLVILDPPAFVKRKKDVVAGCRAYKDINRIALQKMPPQSILLTSSCSYNVDAALFQQVVFQAAVEARRQVRIVGRHRQAVDHPINLFHPEGDYLKSLMLYLP